MSAASSSSRRRSPRKRTESTGEKKMKKASVVILCLSLIPGLAFTQSPEERPEKEESIEELYLSNPGLQIAYEAARSEERESKLLAITQISELLDEGVSAQDEEQISVILRDLSAQGTTVLVREKGRLVNYFPDVRREACRVLASVKSEEGKKKAVKVLAEVLYNDDDPIVKSSAAFSLGVLGMNENEEASRAIARALEIQDLTAPNDFFAYSGAVALKKLAKSNNGISDPRSMRIMTKIFQGNYTDIVQEKALQALNELRAHAK
jgi:HEAT repeat protein